MISINNYINERLILNRQSTVHSDITDLYSNGEDVRYKNTIIKFNSPLENISKLSEEDKKVLLNTVQIILDNVSIPYINIIETSLRIVISCYNDHYGDNINYDKKVSLSYVCGLAIDKSAIRMKKSLSGIGVKYVINPLHYVDLSDPANRFANELKNFVQSKGKRFKFKK